MAGFLLNSARRPWLEQSVFEDRIVQYFYADTHDRQDRVHDADFPLTTDQQVSRLGKPDIAAHLDSERKTGSWLCLNKSWQYPPIKLIES